MTRPAGAHVPLVLVQRQVARERIECAARQVLASRGLGATVEEVANAAAVSVRTVFRHYGTRDHMIATALRSQLHHYTDTLPVPASGATLESWLPELLLEVHRVNALLGRAYWEMVALGDTLDGEVGQVAAARVAARTRFVTIVCRGAWRLAGQRSRPPAWLADLFAVHLSAFTTRELMAGFGRRPDEVAAMSARVLIPAVRSATPG